MYFKLWRFCCWYLSVNHFTSTPSVTRAPCRWFSLRDFSLALTTSAVKITINSCTVAKHLVVSMTLKRGYCHSILSRHWQVKKLRFRLRSVVDTVCILFRYTLLRHRVSLCSKRRHARQVDFFQAFMIQPEVVFYLRFGS